MKILRKTLTKALELTKLAVAKKGGVEQLSHFIFTGDELVTFNNKMAVFFELSTPFACSVRADLFYKQVSKFKSEWITMELNGAKLTLKGDKKEKSTISVLLKNDAEIFKVLHAIQNDHVDCERIAVPGNFGIGMAFASFSASSNTGQGVLQCVSIKDDLIHSSDNYRATQFQIDSPIQDEILLHREVAANLDNFIIREYSMGDNWVSFYCDDGVTVSTRKIYGNYPNYSDAFDMDNWEVALLPEDTEEAIDFVSVIISKEDKLKRIGHVELVGTLLTVSTDKLTEASEKTVALVDCSVEESVEFFINLEFLKSILKHTHELHFNRETQQIMFSDGNFRHIIRMAAR